MNTLNDMHFEQIRVATEKFVNNWSKANGKSTLVHLYSKDGQLNDLAVHLLDENDLNDIGAACDPSKVTLGEWLKNVRSALEKLYPAPTKIEHPSKSTYFFKCDLTPPQGIGEPQGIPGPVRIVTAKYFFNGLTFEFTKDELLKLCVDTRAVNAFINELAGRALAKE